MKTYEECKEIAIERAKAFNAQIDKAYKLGDSFVFDNSEEEYIGVLPMVVEAESGAIKGLWVYLNEKDLSMDDMTEIDL